MEYEDLLYFLKNVGTDPSRLIFEDELTGIYNRRFLLNYFQYKVPWDSLQDHPVSLVMMDLDHFKQINDTHGHNAGDQALIWVATLLKEVARDRGLPIRYAGDEFMILLPHGAKETALEMGEQLIQRVHEEALTLEEVDEEIQITFSIGVASAPDDAESGKSLIQKADTALYFAKKSGRDQLANAGRISPQEVVGKTALHQLEKATIAGRKTQLTQIAQTLKKFSQRQSQFLIIEGSAGMGKSEFLETIRTNLAQSKIWQISVTGIPQELLRPYYMTTNILVEIMNQRPDKGTGILDHLTPQEVNYLTHVLPQLGKPEPTPDQADVKTQREEIFSTLVHFIPKLLNSRPLILLIDDLHFCDEATLLLLRQILLRQDIPLFLCGTASEIKLDEDPGQQAPLELFYRGYQQELNITRVPLTSLDASDIAQHFQTIFPQVRFPEGFEEALAQLTQGNPLFISEILHKLVVEGKITLVGQQWIIEPLEEGYLPRSLEEIVSQKITALDEESKQLLDQASTFGENVSLSMLTGSSEGNEVKVLDFVDQAVAQGLISSEFLTNDETIHFLGKRVQEITYGAIQPDRKHELHERIGTYQEALYEQRLLPSAASLAYHFQRSANQEKARLYQETQQAYDNQIFNVEEAKSYTGDKLSDEAPEDVPLEPTSLAHIPNVIRALLTTVRNIKLYPPGSNAIVTATQQLKETIDKILLDNERLNITHSEDVLTVNGEPVDFTEFKSIAEAFLKFLTRLDLRGIAFSRGLSEHELTVMLEALGRISKKMIDRKFWQRFSAEQRLLHIDLKQIRYTTVAEEDESHVQQAIPQADEPVVPERDFAKPVISALALDEEALAQFPQVIRCLLTAASNIKLYPPESKAITQSIEELRTALQNILTKRPALSLSRVGEALLVNGEKIDTTDFKTMADSFLKLLETLALKSLTFLQHISTNELRTFVTTLGQPQTDGLDSGVWHRLARDHKLSSILFNKHLYDLLKEQLGTGTGQEEPIETELAGQDLELAEAIPDVDADLVTEIAEEPEEKVTISEPSMVEEGPRQLTDASIESMAEQLNDLLLKGNEEQSRQIVEQLFHEFTGQTPEIRVKVIGVCGSLLGDFGSGSQPRLLEVLIDPLLDVIAEEEDFGILRETGESLSRTAANLIQFSDYQRASRILKHLHKRQQQIEESGDQQLQQIVFIQELELNTQRMLLEDLRSQEPTRLQQVTQLLGSLGPAATPLLLEVIKTEDNLRVRQIASHLLGTLGPDAAKLLRRELVLEGIPEERVRILEVIDGVTQDLKTELAYALGDENTKVRRAAIHLAERLNDPKIISLLFDYANHEDVTMAVVAIKTLGKLKPSGAVDLLVSLLDSAKEPERVIASCRALGQIADPGTIDPLAAMLAPGGGFLSLRKKRSSLVRATAAFALSQIASPRVAEVLAPYLEDSDPRVRQLAQELTKKQ